LEVHFYTSLYPITALAAPRFYGRSLAILATLIFSSLLNAFLKLSPRLRSCCSTFLDQAAVQTKEEHEEFSIHGKSLLQTTFSIDTKYSM
jgi:hypothetical protein